MAAPMYSSGEVQLVGDHERGAGEADEAERLRELQAEVGQRVLEAIWCFSEPPL